VLLPPIAADFRAAYADERGIPNTIVTLTTRSSTLGERRCERVKSRQRRYFVQFDDTRCS